MELTPEQRLRKIELLKRKRELLLQSAERPDMEKLQTEATEMARRARTAESGGMVGQIVREAQTPPMGQDPSIIKRALASLADAIVPGGSMAVTRPVTASTVAGFATASPLGKVPEVATSLIGGQLLRGITPDEPVKLPFGMEASSKDIAEGVGDIGTGLAVSGGRQLFRGLSKLSKTAGAKSAAEEAIATLKTSIDDLKFQKATETAPLQARMEGLKPLEVAETSQMKQEATSRIRAIQESSNQLKDSLKSGIDNVKTIITERLPKLTGEAAEVMQTKLKAFFSAGSKAYGDKIDEIVNVLATQGKDKIKRSVLANIVRDTISESAESLITEGQGYDALQKLAEKYQTVSTQDPTTGLIQALPDISIKEVINDLKNVKRLVSSGAQSGASRFAADDIPIEIFRKNMGEFINELTDNAYKGLNNQYKEFLDILKTSNRVFKPYKGSLEAGQGAGLITRVIRKTAKKSDVDLLTALEKGTDLAPGVGRVEGEAKAFYTQARNRIAQQTRKLRNVTREQRTAIQQVSDSVAEGIAKRKDMTLKQKQALQSEIQSISDKITQEISEKKINIEEARAILSDAVKAEKYLKGLKIAGASALVAIPYLRQIFSIGSKVTAVPMGE